MLGLFLILGVAVVGAGFFIWTRDYPGVPTGTRARQYAWFMTLFLFTSLALSSQQGMGRAVVSLSVIAVWLLVDKIAVHYLFRGDSRGQ